MLAVGLKLQILLELRHRLIVLFQLRCRLRERKMRLRVGRL